MNKKLKSMAAAATLAIGLSAGANAAQIETITPPQQDVFYPNVYSDFQAAACTKDNYTVKGIMRVYPSITDLQAKEAKGERVLVKDIQKHVDSAWENFVKDFNSADMAPDAPNSKKAELQQRFQSSASDMVSGIEKETGVTVQPRAAIMPPTPGCNP